MALDLSVGLDLPFQASTNVTAVTLDSKGQYSSGGIPQYAVVVQDVATAGTREVKLAAAASAKALGISQLEPMGPGESVMVRVDGISRAIAAGAITKGDTVMIADATGKIATATAATANFVVGEALEAAAASGDIISIIVRPSLGKVTMP